MLKIGELAKICNVSTQTLRFYDSEGILCADEVDESSGYRYYKPEKVNDYQRLVMLKEMGFSLGEIKSVLNSEKNNGEIYLHKINELTEKIEDMKWNIGKLRKMYDAKDEIFCMRDFDFMRKKFEDDPDAIGKWRLMGEVADFGDFELRETGCHANETLYFLPGGEFYWCFYWSRGILYHMYSSYNVVLPNKYIIEERGGTRYMFVEWLCSKFRDGYEEAAILLYKQEDTMRYTEKETRLCHDDVFLPYVPDDSVIGVWEVYDYIRDISDFSSDKRTYQGRLAYKSIEFFPRGVCRRWYPRYSSHMYYTKGFILDREQELSIAYFIREAEGEAYLFTEHKSGDYMYDGKIYGYYIFKKKKEK